ncbi:MAG: FAD-dependent oxidoreductase [Alphaproteobacteria bacterium]|jgi:glycerol-3-phosphate dehydrogenase|nr:FAD-dependent oxidoreductase [Alphaproteobacteria bacterium]
MAQSFDSIRDRVFDVVVIGGGITGASSAQHLAAAGFSVLLVEKGDFASAASSRSSRLLHSGLRYLAPPKSLWDFVKKPSAFLAGASTARKSSMVGDELARTLPHAVRTTRLLLPIFKTSTFRGWQVDLGVLFLKLIGRRKTPLNYVRRSSDTARGLPFVQWLRQGNQLESVVEIDDHQFHWPERICIDCIMDAERLGAVALNYTAAEGVTREDDLWRVEIANRDGDRASVTAKVLLNFTGVWTDRTNAMVPAGKPPKRQIVGVKGVSIAVQLPERFEGVGIAGINSEGDAIMCVPWGKLHYIGPTETVYEGDIEDVKPEDEDIDELIHEINLFMPGIDMDRSRILHAWAGVRPITYDPSRAKGRRMPFSVLHDLGPEGFPNMLTLTWAAFMSHQPTARRVVNAVRKRIRPSGPPRPLRHDGARDAADSSPPFIESRPEVTRAQIIRSVEKEYARDLVGILYRRTGLGWYVRIPEDKVREAAELVAPILGWDKDDIDREVDKYMAYVRDQHLIGDTDWAA